MIALADLAAVDAARIRARVEERAAKYRQRLAERAAREAEDAPRRFRARAFDRLRWCPARTVAGSLTSEQIGALAGELDAPAIRKERAADQRWRAKRRREVDDWHAVSDALASLGDGLRWEEIQAATNLPEERVLLALKQARAAGYVVDMGEIGWSRTDSERTRTGA